MIYLRIKELLDSRDITQKQLAEMTGIRTATINAIYRDTPTTINKEHISKIMQALDVEDITQVIEYKKEDNA